MDVMCSAGAISRPGAVYTFGVHTSWPGSLGTPRDSSLAQFVDPSEGAPYGQSAACVLSYCPVGPPRVPVHGSRSRIGRGVNETAVFSTTELLIAPPYLSLPLCAAHSLTRSLHACSCCSSLLPRPLPPLPSGSSLSSSLGAVVKYSVPVQAKRTSSLLPPNLP